MSVDAKAGGVCPRPGGAGGVGEAERATGFTHPGVAQMARGFSATPPKEWGSIVSTLNRFLDL